MTIKVGDRIPDATLNTLGESGLAPISTKELFEGKKAVLFGVPGAFTTPCSKLHLPSYVKNAEAIKAKGVQSIVCMAVNDAFVMDAWAKAQGAEGKVLLVADGNAELTKKMGLELDATGFGMGLRCKRFSMIVEDGVVKELNIEAPGEFKVSGAEATCQL